MLTNLFSRYPVETGIPRGRTPRIVMALLMLIVLSATAMPGIAAARDAGEDAGRTERREPDEAGRFELALPNGGELSFIPLHGEAGRLLGYGVAEMLPPDAASYLAIRELRGADPAEIANALSPEGMRFPEELMAQYGRPTQGAQGWALDHEVFKIRIALPCYKATFENDFPGHAPNRVISYDNGPLSYPGAWPYDSIGPEYLNYHTKRSVSGVPSYYAKVTRCEVADLQYTPAGPKVRLEGKQGGVSFIVPLGSLPAYRSTVSFSWYLPSSPNLIMDWTLVVHSAWFGDEFHIGYGWGNLGIK